MHQTAHFNETMQPNWRFEDELNLTVVSAHILTLPFVFMSGSRVAGHRAYFLKGMGVLLNQALINYGLSFLMYLSLFIVPLTPVSSNSQGCALRHFRPLASLSSFIQCEHSDHTPSSRFSHCVHIIKYEFSHVRLSPRG